MHYLIEVDHNMSVKISICRLFIVGFLTSFLWACGQAGPLYLPQDTDKQSNQEESQQQPQKQPEQLPLTEKLSLSEEEK